jgi:hypothetical protein
MAKFKPGQSGNPGGRPKTIAEVRDLARAKTAEAIEALAHIATAGESEAARVSAAVALLDRGWGKAPQAITGEGGEGPVLADIRVTFVRPAPKADA